MTESAAHGIHIDQARDAAFDPDRLRRAFALLEAWVAAGVLPGAAALVARGEQIAGEAYLGLANRHTGQRVDGETIWDVASITKPVTATAAMLLVERGLLSLDEPLVRYLPEFARGAGEPDDRAAVTLRHIFAHCSGLPGFLADNIPLRQAHRPLTAFVRSWITAPLLFAPGAAHYYSNVGILLAAEVVGRALTGTLGQEGKPAVERYHAFVHEELLVPLGMTASALLPPAAWDERIAWVEETGQGADWEVANSPYFRSLGIPWGGLYTCPCDLARFIAAFLDRRAAYNAVPEISILSPATARAMTTIQFAPPDAPRDLAPELRDGAVPAAIRDRVAWGIGWAIRDTKRPDFSGDLVSPQTFGHTGSTGTMVWADPATGIICVLLTNRTLASGWTTERPRMALFSNAVMAAAM